MEIHSDPFPELERHDIPIRENRLKEKQAERASEREWEWVSDRKKERKKQKEKVKITRNVDIHEKKGERIPVHDFFCQPNLVNV